LSAHAVEDGERGPAYYFKLEDVQRGTNVDDKDAGWFNDAAVENNLKRTLANIPPQA